jgi:hypothetical protein
VAQLGSMRRSPKWCQKYWSPSTYGLRVLEAESPPPPDEIARAHYLARRLQVALSDLGLVRPADWITPTVDGLALSDLTLKQTDALVIGLEELITARPSVASRAPDQPSSFGGALR